MKQSKGAPGTVNLRSCLRDNSPLELFNYIIYWPCGCTQRGGKHIPTTAIDKQRGEKMGEKNVVFTVVE